MKTVAIGLLLLATALGVVGMNRLGLGLQHAVLPAFPAAQT